MLLNPVIEEIQNIKSDKRDLRQFGITLAVFFVALALVFFLKHKSGQAYLLYACALFLLAGLFTPTLLKPIQKVWMTLALLMGWVMTRVILCLLFYFVVSPIALLLRFLGKDLLGIKKSIRADSYWLPRQKNINQKNDYEKQF